MSTYRIEAVVKKIVLDNISMSVKADNYDEAQRKAYEVLQTLPAGTTDVSYCYVENRETLETEVISLA